MPFTEIHSRLFNTALLYTLALTLWAFWRYFRKQGLDSSYWGALAIGEILLLLQSGLGAYLYFGAGLQPGRGAFHILYGVVAILGIPAVYAFTKGGDQRRDMLVYAATLAFLCGILLRAAATGY